MAVVEANNNLSTDDLIQSSLFEKFWKKIILYKDFLKNAKTRLMQEFFEIFFNNYFFKKVNSNLFCFFFYIKCKTNKM